MDIQPGKAPAVASLPVKAAIERAHGHLQGHTTEATSKFDAKAAIVKTDDGTLKTNKSLLAQTGKQVTGDAEVSLGAAKDAVKGLLKRDK